MALSDDLQDALVIPLPEDPSLVLDGCRRLLGPNLYDVAPGAIGDALIAGHDRDRVLRSWADFARRMLGALDWRADGLQTRTFEGGASLYVPAAVDQLFTAAYLVEAAWYFAASDVLGRDAIPVDRMIADLARVSAIEANPRLAQLVADAAHHGVDRLLDDDAVMLGHGCGSATWDTSGLPATPDWGKLHDIPLALVTGTNGKTTTTRLITAMGEAAGKVSGLSSTECVKVGTEVLDKGDYSGPAGARLLLRDRRLQIGVLEVARGGILRRGLPVTRARAAVVTNVAADHLGQYGITTVPELARVKLSVHRALAPQGWLILNADDEMVVMAARHVPHAPIWFALDPDHVLIRAARSDARPCGWLEDGRIVLFDGHAAVPIASVADVPLTLGGAARYNIENALAASLAARALGIPDAAIARVLTSFRSDPADNPGRANEFDVRGARVFVDFAHNPHSIAAVTSALAALPGTRRWVLLTHAGDRSDAEIRALATGAFAMRPDRAVVADNPNYLRGRAAGEVPALLAQACREGGLPDDNILMAGTPAEGARLIIDNVAAGDLALLLVHDDRDKIFDYLATTGRQRG